MSQYMGCNHAEIQLNNHECYHSKEELLHKINENKKCIEELKQKLFGMVCGNVKDLFLTENCEGNSIDPIDNAGFEFKELFDSEQYGIIYLIEHNVYLQLMYDNWDKRYSEFDGYGL